MSGVAAPGRFAQFTLSDASEFISSDDEDEEGDAGSDRLEHLAVGAHGGASERFQTAAGRDGGSADDGDEIDSDDLAQYHQEEDSSGDAELRQQKLALAAMARARKAVLHLERLKAPSGIQNIVLKKKAGFVNCKKCGGFHHYRITCIPNARSKANNNKGPAPQPQPAHQAKHPSSTTTSSSSEVDDGREEDPLPIARPRRELPKPSYVKHKRPYRKRRRRRRSIARSSGSPLE